MNEFGRALWERAIKDGVTTQKAYDRLVDKEAKEQEAKEDKNRRRSR